MKNTDTQYGESMVHPNTHTHTTLHTPAAAGIDSGKCTQSLSIPTGILCLSIHTGFYFQILYILPAILSHLEWCYYY